MWKPVWFSNISCLDYNTFLSKNGRHAYKYNVHSQKHGYQHDRINYMINSIEHGGGGLGGGGIFKKECIKRRLKAS